MITAQEAKHNPFMARTAFQRFSWTIGAENSNTITLNGQAKDANNNDVGVVVSGRIYLSDDSVGLDPCATAPSGGMTAGTDGALTQIEHGSSGTGKQFFFNTEADGDLDLVIVESGAKTLYVVVVCPDGSVSVSDAVTFT